MLVHLCMKVFQILMWKQLVIEFLLFHQIFKSGSKEILNGKAGTFFPIKDSDKLSKLLDDFYLNRNKYLKKKLSVQKFKDFV